MPLLLIQCSESRVMPLQLIQCSESRVMPLQLIQCSESRVMPLQLIQCFVSPFSGNLIIKQSVQSMIILSFFNIWLKSFTRISLFSSPLSVTLGV